MTEHNGPLGLERDTSMPQIPTIPKYPDYRKIHALPLPLKIYSLPPLVPHNPLSLLYIAGTYLFHLLYPPSSHPAANHAGYFSPETLSVHITDEAAIRAFWENGFFGKGSLSRSEPSWLIREKRRRGLIVGATSEEITRKRREERKEFKKERARKERELIEKRLREEHEGIIDGHTVSSDVDSAMIQGAVPETPSSDTFLKSDALYAPAKPADGAAVESNGSLPAVRNPGPDSHVALKESDDTCIENQEHLQLTLEEAYFLAYALGVLDIFSPTSQRVVPLQDLLPLFMSHSTFPPPHPTLTEPFPPDNSFLVKYVAYHHFRSLGWVVRSGVKFAVDLLLYNRGPVFSHAEFAVLVLPSYSHAFWAGKNKEKQRTWDWLYMVNRVQTQVRKSLVICYVEIPPPSEHDGAKGLDAMKLLTRYKVREVIFKRWVPNRGRH